MDKNTAEEVTFISPVVAGSEKEAWVPSVKCDVTRNESQIKQRFIVYRWRWFVLCVVAGLNCANAMSWIAYAPVANHVDQFYRAETANYLTLVFLVVAVPVGIIAMWLTAKFGIRSAILLGCWFNGIGAVVRLVSSTSIVSENHRRSIVVVGQVIAACAYPFIMFIPTKTAAAWFPDNQRTLANSIATLSNPLGVLLIMLVAPGIVQAESHVFYLNLLVALISLVVLSAGILGIRSSEPPTPPTRGAAQLNTAFVAGMRKLITSRSYLILLVALGSGMGMFNLLYGMMQQLLCARGYSNSFAGVCCVLMICGGFIGAFASAVIVDKTKKYVQVMKVSFILAMTTGLVFSFCALKPSLSVAIALACFIFGFFGLAAYPIGLEMAVECSFPVSETLSAGLIVLAGQIFSTAYMAGMKIMRDQLIIGEDALYNETCSQTADDVTTTTLTTLAPSSEKGLVKAYDMTLPLLLFVGIAGAVVAMFVVAFKPKLRRLNLERSGQEEMIDLSSLKSSMKNVS